MRRASVNNLKAPQQVGEFFLIGGAIRLPFKALARRERLVLARLSVDPVIDVMELFGDRGRFQELAYSRKRGETSVEMLGTRLKERKARSPRWVLLRFERRFEVRSDVQEFVNALADAIGTAPDRVELNNQNVFRRKSVEIWPEVAREASEVSEKRIFHHLLKRFRQRGHHGVSVVPVPGINHFNRRSQANQQFNVRPVSGDPGRRFLRVEIGGTKLSAARNGSDDRRKLFVIPSDTSLKAAQLLARHAPQDRVGEIVDLLIWSEADLRMSVKLGGKPGGPAFGRANANKVDQGHMRHYWRSSSESILRALRRFHFLRVRWLRLLQCPMLRAALILHTTISSPIESKRLTGRMQLLIANPAEMRKYTRFFKEKNMTTPLRTILSTLLIWGSSLLVPHHLYAQAPPGWGTATSIGNTFTPPAQFPKMAVDLHGDAIAVWQQGDSAGVLSIWANRYDVGSGSWGTATLIESNSGVATKP